MGEAPITKVKVDDVKGGQTHMPSDIYNAGAHMDFCVGAGKGASAAWHATRADGKRELANTTSRPQMMVSRGCLVC